MEKIKRLFRRGQETPSYSEWPSEWPVKEVTVYYDCGKDKNGNPVHPQQQIHSLSITPDDVPALRESYTTPCPEGIPGHLGRFRKYELL